MENRYYIAVPTKVKRFSYQTIFTWKNYSFTGTHDEAMMTAIELFDEDGHFDNIVDNLIDYYEKDHGENNANEEYKCKWYDWDNWSIEEKWENCRNYFIDFFRLDNCDEIVSGVGLWKDYSNEFKKNWDEDANRLHFIEIE